MNDWMKRLSNLHMWHEWALYIRIIRNAKFYLNHLSTFDKIKTEKQKMKSIVCKQFSLIPVLSYWIFGIPFIRFFIREDENCVLF